MGEQIFYDFGVNIPFDGLDPKKLNLKRFLYVQEMTQEEYDAIKNKDTNTLYIITDAE